MTKLHYLLDSMAGQTMSHIGSGRPAVVREQASRATRGMVVCFQEDDIHEATDWRIHTHEHAVVVHLGGAMRRLETELEGAGGSYGPALPGEVWTVPAGRRYASHACGGVITYALIHLTAEHVGQFCEGCGRGMDLAAVAARRDVPLFHAVSRLRTSVGRAGDDASLMAAEQEMHAVARLISRSYGVGRSVSERKSAAPELCRRRIRRLKAHVHEQLGTCLTLDGLAELAEMTVHHFLVAFRRAFATTPAQYVMHQRLRRAQHELVSTRKDITTIALDCGFSSHSHLTSTFTRLVGEAPSHYRREMQHAPAGAGRMIS